MARFDDQYSRGARSDRSTYQSMATGLGWFSIGLGLAEVAAPDSVARLIGVRNSSNARRTLQSFGMREIANGLALLQSSQDSTWLWTRVGGDAIDAATLWRALDDPNNDRNKVLTAIGAVAGIATLDAVCAAGLSQRSSHEPSTRARRQAQANEAPHGIRVRKSFTINRQPDVVYGFWRKLENLPRFMRHLESVEVIDAGRSRWRAKAPAGMTVEWQAEITDDRPNEHISWRSVEGSTVPNRGTVRFAAAPGARGTEVHVDLEYSVPGGRVSSTIARLFGREPGQQIEDDLRRLKQLLETGEIARSSGSAQLWQPAQPAPDLVRQQIAQEGAKR
jgi:uncharacterized membrane protein